jgi:hypothetical protein
VQAAAAATTPVDFIGMLYMWLLQSVADCALCRCVVCVQLTVWFVLGQADLQVALVLCGAVGE